MTAFKTLNSKKTTASRFDTCVKTVDRLIADGKLGTVQIGRRVLIPEEEIQRFLGTNFTPAFDAKMEAESILGLR